MSNRIDISLQPAGAVGFLAALPWLALAAAATGMTASGNVWPLPVVALGLAGAVHALRHQGLLANRRSVCGLRVSGEQLLALHRDGSTLAVAAGASSRIGTRFSVLQLRLAENGHYHTTVLLLCCGHGNLQADDARRLRLWLRLGQKPAPGSARA